MCTRRGGFVQRTHWSSVHERVGVRLVLPQLCGVHMRAWAPTCTGVRFAGESGTVDHREDDGETHRESAGIMCRLKSLNVIYRRGDAIGGRNMRWYERLGYLSPGKCRYSE